MATEKKYLDTTGLQVYTELIKGKIGEVQAQLDNVASNEDLKAAFGSDYHEPDVPN